MLLVSLFICIIFFDSVTYLTRAAEDSEQLKLVIECNSSLALFVRDLFSVFNRGQVMDMVRCIWLINHLLFLNYYPGIYVLSWYAKQQRILWSGWWCVCIYSNHYLVKIYVTQEGIVEVWFPANCSRFWALHSFESSSSIPHHLYTRYYRQAMVLTIILSYFISNLS